MASHAPKSNLRLLRFEAHRLLVDLKFYKYFGAENNYWVPRIALYSASFVTTCVFVNKRYFGENVDGGKGSRWKDIISSYEWGKYVVGPMNSIQTGTIESESEISDSNSNSIQSQRVGNSSYYVNCVCPSTEKTTNLGLTKGRQALKYFDESLENIDQNLNNFTLTLDMKRSAMLLAPIQHHIYCWFQQQAAIMRGENLNSDSESKSLKWINRLTSLKHEDEVMDLFRKTIQSQKQNQNQQQLQTPSDSMTFSERVLEKARQSGLPECLIKIWDDREYLTMKRYRHCDWVDPVHNPTGHSYGHNISSHVDVGYPQYSFEFLDTIISQLEDVGVVKIEKLIPLSEIRRLRNDFQIKPLVKGPYDKLKEMKRIHLSTESNTANATTAATTTATSESNTLPHGTHSQPPSALDDEVTNSFANYDNNVVSEFETRRVDSDYIRDYHRQFLDDGATPETPGSKRRTEVQLQEPSIGRRHFILRDTGLEEKVRPILTYLTPIVNSYFETIGNHQFRFEDIKQGLLPRICPRDNTSIIEDKPHPAPYISELQLVTVDPLARIQYWHKDHTAPGLTVVIPLTLMPEKLGATVFLGYSHTLRTIGKAIRGDCAAKQELIGKSNSGSSTVTSDSTITSDSIPLPVPGGPLRFSLKPEDVLIHDSRILKCGDVNKLYSRATVAIWIRYDVETPPGQGIVLAQMFCLLGKILNRLDWLQKYV